MKYLDKTLLKYKEKEHKDPVIIASAKPASIPAKKLAATAYTGNGTDVVGPAAYNPKLDIVRQKAPEKDFAADKTKRELFGASEAQKQLPGPGVYDYEKLGPKAFNSSGNYSIFQSKVPNCADRKIKNDVPGPGTYKNPLSLESRVMSHQRASSDGQFIGSDPQSFLSKTKKGDWWRNEGETPFTKQSYLQNPGPGHYKLDKKKDDLKHKIMTEEAVHAAFNSSDVRPMNKKVKSANPGPGTYIDISNPVHSSIRAAVVVDRTQQEEQGIKIGPFGSNSARSPQWLSAKEGPDPG